MVPASDVRPAAVVARPAPSHHRRVLRHIHAPSSHDRVASSRSDHRKPRTPETASPCSKHCRPASISHRNLHPSTRALTAFLCPGDDDLKAPPARVRSSHALVFLLIEHGELLPLVMARRAAPPEPGSDAPRTLRRSRIPLSGPPCVVVTRTFRRCGCRGNSCYYCCSLADRPHGLVRRLRRQWRRPTPPPSLDKPSVPTGRP